MGVYCPRMSCREKKSRMFSRGSPVVCLLVQTLVERGDGSGLHRDSGGSEPAHHCVDVRVGARYEVLTQYILIPVI